MKKLTLILALAIAALNFKGQQSAVSNRDPWQSAVLRADGLLDVEGVEAYSMRTTCGTNEVVLIKFVNKNNYRVRVEWKDAIKTAGGWIYSKTAAPKTLYLEPGNTVLGDCGGLEKLKVSVGSIIDNPQDFGYFSVSGLVTIKLTQNTK